MKILPLRRVLFLAGLLLALLVTPSFAAKTADVKAEPVDEVSTDLDVLFTFAYPEDAPGATVIVVRDGETLLRAGYGMANLELEVAMEPDMVLGLGSVTKQFTAVALLMLAQEGKVKLDAPLTDYLPDYPQGSAPITLRHLLTHTSGIQSYTAMDNFLDQVAHKFTVDEMIDRFKDEPMNFAPGEKYAYNNSAYFLLGAVIEKVSGMSYEEFIEERIFAPLGMEHSYYGDPEQVVPRRASGYGGRPGAYRNARYIDMSQPYSAGALLSTVDDLAKWDAALYGDTLLPAQRLQEAWTAAKLNDGRSIHYGFGWSVTDYEGYTVLRHGGAIFGFVSHVVRIPEAKIFVAVLSNNPVLPPGPGELALRAALMALGKPLEGRVEAKLDSALLDEYVGLYEIEGDAENWRMVTRKGDRLYTQRRRGHSFALLAAKKDQFYYADSAGLMRFVRSENGEVVGMEWSDGAGPTERARKSDREPPAARRTVKVAPEVFDQWVGRYRWQNGVVMTLSREGDHFFAQLTNQPKFEIFAESPTVYFLKVVEADIEFLRDSDGKANELVLRQGGRELHYHRIEGSEGSD